MKTKVISVFPASGKTWLYEHQRDYGLKILDSDSSKFSWKTVKVPLPDMGDGCEYTDKKVRDPEFPNNYIAYIKEQIESNEYDVIFVSSHEEVRKALHDANIIFKVVIPNKRLLNEWIGRCYRRELNGENGFPIKVLIDNWNKWIDSCMSSIDYGTVVVYILQSNEYLSDAIFDLLYKEVIG